MGEPRLKPCPFCGGHAFIEIGLHTATIRCGKCGIRTIECEDAAPLFEEHSGPTKYMDCRMTCASGSAIGQAVGLWNRRVNDAVD